MPAKAILALCLLAAAAQPALAREPVAEVNQEYAIKAAYLFNFGRYVQWPQEAVYGRDAPLVIGVLGKNPFGGLLDQISQKKLEGRPIAVLRLSSMAEYKPCHILFVAASATAEDKSKALKLAQYAPILLVGEEAGFAEQGGTINFVVEENKVRFQINPDAAKRSQLKISSKLLGLARIVGQH